MRIAKMSATRWVGQKPLIKAIKSFGYNVDTGGVCFGVANVGKDFVLTHTLQRKKTLNLAQFRKPFDLISQYGPDLSFRVSLARRERKAMALGARFDAFYAGLMDQNLKSLTHQNQLNQHVNQYIQKAESLFPEEHRDLLNIPPLFESIALYQDSARHSYLFKPNAAPKNQLDSPKVHALLQPHVWGVSRLGHTQTGIVPQFHFSGLYTISDLEYCFQTFADKLSTHKFNLPLPLISVSLTHAMTLAYTPTINQWDLLNANNCPFQTLSSAYQAALKIHEGFNNEQFGFVSNHLHAPYIHHAALSKVIKDCWKEKIWREIHRVTPEKARLVSPDEITWLHFAADLGEPRTVKSLLSVGADPNYHGPYEDTALIFAARRGHLDVVNLLLAHHSDPNIQGKREATPIHYAAAFGHHEIVKSLLKYGANPRLQTDEGENAYDCASSKGHTTITALLKDSLFCSRKKNWSPSLFNAGTKSLERSHNKQTLEDSVINQTKFKI